MWNRIGLSCLGVLLAAAGCRDVAPDDGVYGEFVRAQIVPDRIARLDTTQSELISSYDRAGGNDDFNNFAGREGTNWAVLADLTGPGYVSRFWITGGTCPRQRLRFYFDNERQPRLDASVYDLREGRAPFISSLSRYEHGCWYSWVPLPFAKRLRILAETSNYTHQGWPRLFYQLNYRKLPADADVPKFPMQFGPADVEALAAFGADFEGANPLPAGLEIRRGESLSVAPGAEGVVLALSGGGVIRDLTLRVLPVAERESLMLRMTWDGQPGASIATPLDAFFGKLWRSPDFTCAFVGTSGEVSRCRLPMPFHTGAMISVSNAGSQAVTVAAEALVTPAAPADAALGYLHAVWHRSGTEARGRPHTILQAAGRGKVVGCLMGINSADPSWWALEGDESIRIDDETKPGWLGTGLEDYFSGAWYYKNNLVRPQHGLVFKRPFTTVQYRFHVDDARTFQRRAEMLFERGPDQMSPASFASVGYYYLDQPATAASDALDGTSSAPPPDQFEEAAIMSTLCNFERLGDYAGAIACITRYVKAFHPAFTDILELRKLAYREHVEGFSAIKPLYEEYLRASTNEPAAGYARLLLWFHEQPDRALLSFNCGGPTRVYLDGAAVGEAGHPQAFTVVPVTLTPGPHVLCLQAFRPQAQGPNWVQAALRTHSGLFGTTPDWRFAPDPSGDWRLSGYDESAWTPAGDSVTEGPPPLPYVATQPHPFVDLQSRPWGIFTSVEWPPEGRTFVFRKEFTVPP